MLFVLVKKKKSLAECHLEEVSSLGSRKFHNNSLFIPSVEKLLEPSEWGLAWVLSSFSSSETAELTLSAGSNASKRSKDLSCPYFLLKFRVSQYLKVT